MKILIKTLPFLLVVAILITSAPFTRAAFDTTYNSGGDRPSGQGTGPTNVPNTGQTAPAETNSKGSAIQCSPWDDPTTIYYGCPILLAVYILELVLRGTSWFITIAAGIMNVVLALQNTAFHDVPLVNIGWKIARDVVNIFYILFLLIIAIATILGISSYSSRQLLAKLLLSALLVNFSLPLAGIIIDVSNALGNTFYAHMGTDQGDGTRDIASTIVKGFQPQNIYKPLQTNGTVAPILQGQLTSDTVFNIILVYILGTILEFIMAFTILAAAFLLVGRIVYLWIILIVSPFAFLFMVLPRTSDIFNTWISRLFNQSFFYPAYMFFLYLVLRTIDARVLDTFFKSADQNNTITKIAAQQGVGTASVLTNSASLILTMVTLAILMVASLIIANRMGATGASTAMAYGNKFQKSARETLRSAGNRYVAAPLSRGVVEGRVGQTLARIPIAKQMLRYPVESIKAADKDLKKRVEFAKNLPAEARAAYINSLGSRRKGEAYQMLSDDEKRDTIGKMNETQQIQLARSIDFAKPGKKLKNEVATFSGSTETAMKILHEKEPPKAGASQQERDDYQKHVNEFVANLSEKDVSKIKKETIGNDTYFHEAMFRSFNANDIRRLAQSKENAEELQRAFTSLSITLDQTEIATKLRAKNNENLAKWVEKSPAFHSIIRRGERASKRDLTMGTPSSTPPPAPPPTP